VKRFRHLLLLIAFILGPAHAYPVDLTRIERTIAKEPVYESKAPEYCLLVFGARAQTRVWLVRDGSDLFVDRNGNGDLTEDGEKLKPDRGTWFVPKLELPGFGANYRSLSVILRKGFSRIDVVGDAWGLKGLRSYAAFMTFAKTAREAPIVHFFGPLGIGVAVSEGGARNLVAWLGTPGLGKGTFTMVSPALVMTGIPGEMVASAKFPDGTRATFPLYYSG
jgi:hypothetical protein